MPAVAPVFSMGQLHTPRGKSVCRFVLVWLQVWGLWRTQLKMVAVIQQWPTRHGAVSERVIKSAVGKWVFMRLPVVPGNCDTERWIHSEHKLPSLNKTVPRIAIVTQPQNHIWDGNLNSQTMTFKSKCVSLANNHELPYESQHIIKMQVTFGHAFGTSSST